MRNRSKFVRSLNLEYLESRCVFSAGPFGAYHCLSDALIVEQILANSPGAERAGQLAFLQHLHFEQADRGVHSEIDMGLRAEGEGEPTEVDRHSSRPTNEIDRLRNDGAGSKLPPQVVISLHGPTVDFIIPTVVQLNSHPAIANNVSSISNFTGNLSGGANIQPADNSAGRDHGHAVSPVTTGLQSMSMPLLTLNFSLNTGAPFTTLPSESRNLEVQKQSSTDPMADISGERGTVVSSISFAGTSPNEHRASLESHLGHLYDPPSTSSSVKLNEVIESLARDHRQSQTSEISRDASVSHWRPAAQETLDFQRSGKEGGMITLAINRDFLLEDLDLLAEDVLNERNAWSTNLGVYRALEVGGFAMTQALPIRNAQAISMAARDEERAETSPSQPILASTSVAFLAGLYGLRRVRKARRLQLKQIDS